MAELPVPGARIELGLEGASDEGSRMVGVDGFAVLVLRLSGGGDKYAEVLVPKSLG